MAAIGVASHPTLTPTRSVWRHHRPKPFLARASAAVIPNAVSPLVPLTNYGALLSLASVQMWLKAVRKSAGIQCSPSIFTNLSTLHKTVIGPYGQRTNRRLILLKTCYSCGADVPFTETSEGDHVVAKSQGGSLGIDDFAPICPTCNSEKGSFNLLYWWGERKHRTLEETTT